MARAKRTDRTEARRRHRSEQASLAAAATEREAQTELDGGKASAKGASAQTPPQPRPSIVGAFRGAIHPLDLRGDLRAAPRVVAHWGVLAAIGIAILSSVVFVVSTSELAQSIDWTAADPFAGKQLGTVSNISYLAFSLFVAPPPAAGGFLIGFTAKRASWLGGLVFGIVAAVCYIGVLQTPAGLMLTGGQSGNAAIVNAAAVSPIGAALFASVAAWYRRFLELANPNRGQRQQAQRKTQGRGDMKPARR